MKNSYRYIVNTYNAHCYLFVGSEKDFYRYIKRLCAGLEDTKGLIGEDWAAGAFTFKHRRYGTKFVIWLSSFTGTCSEYRNLVHEVTHVAMNILSDVGINYMREGETLAYLTDSIFSDFLYQLTKELDKDKDNKAECR